MRWAYQSSLIWVVMGLIGLASQGNCMVVLLDGSQIQVPYSAQGFLRIIRGGDPTADDND